MAPSVQHNCIEKHYNNLVMNKQFNFTISTDDYDRALFSSPNSKEKEMISPPPPGPAFVRTSFISPILMKSINLQQQPLQPTNTMKSTPLTRLMQRRANERAKTLESSQNSDTIHNNLYVKIFI